MKNFSIFLTLLGFFFIQQVHAQEVDSKKFVYDNQYPEDEDEGDAIPTPEDIILKVSPNPVGSEAEVVFKNLPGDGKATLSILDMNGKVCKRLSIGNERERSGKLLLPTQGLSSGLYIIHLSTAWGRLAKRMLIK